MSCLRGVGGVNTYLSATLMLNQMISGNVGFYNGLFDSFGAAGKALAPLICGAIFAAATQDAGAASPFAGAALPFMLVCLLCLVALAFTLRLSRSQSKMKPLCCGCSLG